MLPTTAGAASIRLGTRSSPLAMWQANFVRLMFASTYPTLRVDLVPISTQGDTDLRPFSEFAERGIFAKEIEQALLDGRIDCAVHSAKDLRLDDAPGLKVAAVLTREDAHDVLVGSRALADLGTGDRVATGSARRRAQLLAVRPDLEVVGIRGNVQTRLKTFRERGDSACILAAAGLRRLGLSGEIGCTLPVEEFVPEAGQGAIVVQTRVDDDSLVDWHRLSDTNSEWALSIERSLAAHFGGGCDAPLGVHVDTTRLSAHVFAAAPDSSQHCYVVARIDRDAAPEAVVTKVIACAISEGIEDVLAAVKK